MGRSYIPAADLVHEQQRLVAGARVLARFGEHLLQLGDAGEHRRHANVAQAHRIGEQPWPQPLGERLVSRRRGRGCRPGTGRPR